MIDFIIDLEKKAIENYKKQKNYEVTFEVVKDQFKKTQFKHLVKNVKLGEGSIINGNTFVIPFFGENHLIKHPEVEITREDKKPVSLAAKILLLRYILNIIDKPLSGELISYKHIPGAFNYYPVFTKKNITPILMKYKNIDDLKKACFSLKGKEVSYGDFSYEFNVFPKTPITLIYYKGDDEFLPSLDFLFDNTIQYIFSQEDVVVLTNLLSKRILYPPEVKK